MLLFVRGLIVIGIGVLLASCHPRFPQTPPKAYLDVRDRIAAATGLPLLGWGPCQRALRDDTYKPRKNLTEICYKMTPPRRMRGLWRYEFEGSQFCPSPATRCDYVSSEKRIQPQIWLSIPFHLPDTGKPAREAVYAIDFIGRRTMVPGHYGHMGVFDEEVVVDRLISMKEVEAPHEP
jgi:hypothetical protein